MGNPIASVAASSTGSAPGPVTVVLVRNNAHSTMVVDDVQLSREQLARHLSDPARVECPATAKLGMPLCLVSPVLGRALIPQLSCNPLELVIGNPDNANARASRLAIDVVTGFAPGVVIGHANAIRTDCADLTTEQWAKLDDAIYGDLLGTFSEGEGAVTEETWEHAKAQLQYQLEHGDDEVQEEDEFSDGE